MPVDFPEKFLVINRILGLFFCLDRVRVVSSNLFFLFGHSWREKRVEEVCELETHLESCRNRSTGRGGRRIIGALFYSTQHTKLNSD